MQTAPGTGGDPAGGFAKAVEMCNNNGHCRKFDAGTMCPSYRITQNEQHLTRGRANTLRLALSGAIPGGVASEAVQEALALCVGCKGCKRECPTGVDMARMKIEVAGQRRRKYPLKLRERLVAYLPHYAAKAAPFAALLNLRDKLPGMAALSQAVLGIASARSMPRWRSDTFWRRQRRSAAPIVPMADADLVLWVDTLNNAFDPQILEAALTVLQAAGKRVALAQPPAGERPLCCGRTFMASGLIDQAREETRRVLDALAPAIAKGLPVVGLEPSCLLTLRDETLTLGLGEPAEKLAELARTFEEYLAAEHQAGTLPLALQPLAAGKVWLHGHCHQKAHDAVRPIQTVLGLIPDLELALIESSCCGMAGAFGFEAEHYDASMAMGELSLLPAVRKAEPNALVVADGTSCRHQIHDGAQREALHVAQILQMALADKMPG